MAKDDNKKVGGSRIIKCGCRNPGQDTLHGEGKRVGNAFAGPMGKVMYRCTVCKTER